MIEGWVPQGYLVIYNSNQVLLLPFYGHWTLINEENKTL